jgi:putative hemolysin
VDNGGQLEIVDQEAGGQIGVCHFPGGSQCEEWSYFRGECKPGQATAIPPMTPEANMPNPASAYCEQVGGELKIEKTDAGEIGICVFSDGSQCEEWALFNNECQPGLATAVPSVTPRIAMPDPSAAFCVKHGGKVKIMTRRDGGQYALCIFKNGSRCDTWAFYRGKCHPATPTPKPQKRIIGMRNPASVYCAQQGGTHQTMTMMDGGEVGICVFPNGNQCEEWALYHGQCSP